MRNRFVILTVILSITLPIILARSLDVKKTNTATTNEDFMMNAIIINYDATGRVVNRLTTTKWSIHQDDSGSSFETPKLELIRNNGCWNISSDFGVANHDSNQSVVEKIVLEKNVVIEQKSHRDSTKSTLYTDALDYYPKTELAKTDKFVTIKKPDKKITGFGMDGDLKQNTFKIRKNVKTWYQE